MLHQKNYVNGGVDALLAETCELANRPVRRGGLAWRGTKAELRCLD